MRQIRRAAWAIVTAFEKAEPAVAWVEFVGGISALLLTWPLQVLPPFNDHPGNVLLTCVAWLLVAQEGFHTLADRKG